MTDRVLLSTPTTLDEFERFIAQPENAEHRFEFIDGELIEVPSNPYSSAVATLISAAMLGFVRPRKLGHVTGEQGVGMDGVLTGEGVLADFTLPVRDFLDE